jgi:hypothetical protein
MARLQRTAGESIGPLGNRLDAETQARLLARLTSSAPFSKSFRSILMSFVV